VSKPNRIEIENPKPGGSRFTTIKKAIGYIYDGMAIITDDKKLFFIRDKKRREKRLAHIRKMSEEYRRNPDKLSPRLSGTFRDCLLDYSGMYPQFKATPAQTPEYEIIDLSNFTEFKFYDEHEKDKMQ